MEPFACGHPRDLWNVKVARRKEGSRTGWRQDCLTCARRQSRDREQRIVAFPMCSDCGMLLRQTYQGRRKDKAVAHRCRTVETNWQGILCMRCGAFTGKRPRSLCPSCKRTNTMWHYNNDPVYRQSVIDAAKHRVHLKRSAQARGEVITIVALIERDGDACYLCGVAVRDDVPIGHPLKANIDHVIPISKGGQHTLDNVRVACRGCNSAKGAKVAA